MGVGAAFRFSLAGVAVRLACLEAFSRFRCAVRSGGAVVLPAHAGEGCARVQLGFFHLGGGHIHVSMGIRLGGGRYVGTVVHRGSLRLLDQFHLPGPVHFLRLGLSANPVLDGPDFRYLFFEFNDEGRALRGRGIQVSEPAGQEHHQRGGMNAQRNQDSGCVGVLFAFFAGALVRLHTYSGCVARITL